MNSLFFLSVASSHNCYYNETILKVNCLMCVDDGCGWCWDSGNCYNKSSSEFQNCQSNSQKRDEKCLATMGGDYKSSTRIAVGISIIILALIVDLPIRFCTKPDEYSQI